MFSRFRLVPPNVMVRIVGGECTGSCRLGHVFLTFLSFPPSYRCTPSPLSAARFFFFFPCFYSLYLRREKRRRGRNRVAREREKEARMRHDKQRVEWERRVVEGEGTRYFTPASLFLASSISPSLHLGTVDARSIITLPLSPPLPSSLLVLVANLSPSLHLLLLLLRHFSTPATFPSLVAPRYLVPRPVTRSWPSFNVPPPLRCVHSQLHTTRRRPERCRDTRLSASRE